MNAILYRKQNDVLTKEEEQYFKKAEDIIKQYEKEKKKDKKPKKGASKVSTIILIILALVITLFCTIFALSNINNKKILKNISILGIDVSELSVEEAKDKLNNNLAERLSTEIITKHNDENYIIPPRSIDASFNIEKAVKQAYMIGRSGNIIQNNFEILKQMLNKTDIELKLFYNETALKDMMPHINESFKDGRKSPSYDIQGNELTITAGKDGYVVNYEELKNLITNKLISYEYNTEQIEIPVTMAKREEIDIEKIHNEIYKEPQDATYTVNPYKITASQTGLDFAISMEEAKNQIAENKETYTIKLKTLYPKVTTDSIGAEAFPDLLSTYTTNYSSSGANRSNNVALAASKINGVVLMPGEVFSYNGTVGKRTIAAGFKEAGAYVNGKSVNEVGGGICQVSSTLYNSVLRANLEIVARTNHMFTVGYVPIGTDATVSWGAPDFKFKNNRDYAIRIVATTYNKNVTIKIYGLKQENDYNVEILSYRTGTIGYKTTYTNDSSLAPGQTKVIQSGSNGATAVAYRILKKDGKEISRELLSRDTYSPHNQIIARGN